MTEEHPNQWWLTADKAAILDRIKATCETLDHSVSTTELVEIMFPESTARGPGNDRRQALFARLQTSAARELAPYATRGEPVPSRFGPRRPWRWHKPESPTLEASAAELHAALWGLMQYVGGWDSAADHPCGIARDLLQRLEAAGIGAP